MPDDPRRAALEALFVVREEDGGRMAALTLPSIPSGGWAEHEDGGERQNPYGAKARILALRDAVIGEALRLIDAAAPGAVLASIVRAEEHERAALVRERDEARAELYAAITERNGLLREVAAQQRVAEERLERALVAEKEADHFTGKLEEAASQIAALMADLERERLTVADLNAAIVRLSPAAQPRQQLALFAAAEADPAWEAQRAAASGAAVGAIVGAAADAPAPKPAKVPAPVCAPCGGVPLVPAADMPREGEATGGQPLGCPACGEGYDGTPEQIARAQADSEAATKRIAAAEGKCWRCWKPRHRGRCKGAR